MENVKTLDILVSDLVDSLIQTYWPKNTKRKETIKWTKSISDLLRCSGLQQVD